MAFRSLHRFTKVRSEENHDDVDSSENFLEKDTEQEFAHLLPQRSLYKKLPYVFHLSLLITYSIIFAILYSQNTSRTELSPVYCKNILQLYRKFNN
jgi:hypothetical protein